MSWIPPRVLNRVDIVASSLTEQLRGIIDLMVLELRDRPDCNVHVQ